MCIGTAEGEKGYARHVKDQVAKVCRQYRAMNLTGYATMLWEKTRYKEPYMREDLMDYGIIIDTVESGVTWNNLHRLHQGVRAYIKKRPQTICMTHASHFYPQGTNLYFIFILKAMPPCLARMCFGVLTRQPITCPVQQVGKRLMVGCLRRRGRLQLRIWISMAM